MTKIREDLIGVVWANYADGSPVGVPLSAGDDVPVGAVVGDHVLDPDTVEPEQSYPEGEPASDWKIPELKAWAKDHQVDLGGVKVKDEILAALVKPSPIPDKAAGSDGQ